MCSKLLGFITLKFFFTGTRKRAPVDAIIQIPHARGGVCVCGRAERSPRTASKPRTRRVPNNAQLVRWCVAEGGVWGRGKQQETRSGDFPFGEYQWAASANALATKATNADATRMTPSLLRPQVPPAPRAPPSLHGHLSPLRGSARNCPRTLEAEKRTGA